MILDEGYIIKRLSFINFI